MGQKVVYRLNKFQGALRRVLLFGGFFCPFFSGPLRPFGLSLLPAGRMDRGKSHSSRRRRERTSRRQINSAFTGAKSARAKRARRASAIYPPTGSPSFSNAVSRALPWTRFFFFLQKKPACRRCLALHGLRPYPGRRHKGVPGVLAGRAAAKPPGEPLLSPSENAGRASLPDRPMCLNLGQHPNHFFRRKRLT